ncbi:hypothetical protein DMC47_23555 [Nostoc sp. 3335mG]|nr:hypothetical protein DMC47_23555 [Nostoc sp. 3335mG]
MRYVTMIVALMALALPASAQTFTAPPAASYQSPTELVDKTPGDGVIRFTTKRGGIAKGRDAKLCPDYRPRFLYVDAREACPTLVVEPPVVVAPPPVSSDGAGRAVLSAEGESFVQNASSTLGFADNASIGTIKNAPTGFRTDAKNGAFRSGWLGIRGDDFILPGAAIAGFTATINGKPQSNMRLRSYTQWIGGFVAPLHWKGASSGIDLDIAMTLVGSDLSHVMTFTNTTGSTVRIGLHWSTDPDQADAHSSTNRVTAKGTVESTLMKDAGVYYLTTADPTAYIGFAAWNSWAVAGAAQPVGTLRKADDVVQLIFPPVVIEPGQSHSFRFRQGLRQ